MKKHDIMERSIIMNIPETAVLTYVAEKSHCSECFESLTFQLKDSKYEFSIGLLDILKCLKFAEQQGTVPSIPYEWWNEVQTHYQLE